MSALPNCRKKAASSVKNSPRGAGVVFQTGGSSGLGGVERHHGAQGEFFSDAYYFLFLSIFCCLEHVSWPWGFKRRSGLAVFSVKAKSVKMEKSAQKSACRSDRVHIAIVVGGVMSSK